MAKLGDFLSSINYKKNNVFAEDPTAETNYVPFVINRTLSYFVDTVILANEMNRLHNASKSMQYDFLLHTVRPGKRFKPWHKTETLEDVQAVQEYYNISNRKAIQTRKLLTDEQRQYIKQQTYKGGTQ